MLTEKNPLTATTTTTRGPAAVTATATKTTTTTTQNVKQYQLRGVHQLRDVRLMPEHLRAHPHQTSFMEQSKRKAN